MKVKISTLFLLLIWTLSTSGCIPRILAKEFRHIELTREINSFEATRTSYRQTQIPSFKSDFRDIEPNLYQLEFTNFYMFFDMSKFKEYESIFLVFCNDKFYNVPSADNLEEFGVFLFNSKDIEINQISNIPEGFLVYSGDRGSIFIQKYFFGSHLYYFYLGGCWISVTN